MERARLKTIVFDMDGVLIDSEYTYIEAKLAILHEEGFDKSEDYLYQFMGTTREYMWRTMKDQLGLPRSIDEYITDMDRRRRKIIARDGIIPIKGAVEVVKELSHLDIPLAVASSTERPGIIRALDAIGIKDYFQFLVSGEEVKHSKPAPDVYLRAVERLAYSPEECLAVEDTVNGTLSASRAGLYVAAYVNPSYPLQDLSAANVSFKDYDEFLPQFQSLFEIK